MTSRSTTSLEGDMSKHKWGDPNPTNVRRIIAAALSTTCQHADHDDCPEGVDMQAWCDARNVIAALSVAGLQLVSVESPIG